MHSKNFGVILVLILLLGMLVWLSQREAPARPSTAVSSDGYSYRCDDGVRFRLTLSADANSIHIEPVGYDAFPPAGVLLRAPAQSGVRFEGNGVVLTAIGEQIWLSTTQSTAVCQQVGPQGAATYRFSN